MLHGHVSEEHKAELYARRVGEPDRLLGRGLVPDGDGGRDLRHAERGAARSAGCPSRSIDGETGLLADDGPELTAAVQRARRPTDALRERMGASGRASARATFTWERTARETLDVLEATAAARARRAARASLARSETAEGRRHGRGDDGQQRRSRWSSPSLFARLLGADGLRLARPRWSRRS